ncbi:MAG: chemotaxis protein CheW [Bacillota bacterium]
MDQETAMAELRRCSGTRFDPGMVEVFLKVLEKRQKKFLGVLSLSNNNQLVVFKVADQDYALPILETREIIRLVQITPLPDMPAYLKGVINLRGRIVPVVDLRLKLGLQAKEMTGEAKIIVVDHNNRYVGLIVDKVSGVGYFNEDEFESLSDDLENRDEAVSGIVRKENALWLLLKTGAVCNLELDQKKVSGAT